jgi:hypothetical protein
MSDVEQALRQAAQPYLRATEQINGCGAMSRVVPIAARLIPLTAWAYAGHYLVVATNERLLLFATSFSLFGSVTPPSNAPVALELADVARVEPFNPAILGHDALRFTLRTGLVQELMYRRSIGNLASHATFALQFPAWLVSQVAASSFPPRSDAERTIPALAPRPAVGTWILLVGGGLSAVGGSFMALAMIASGFSGDVVTALPFVLWGAISFAIGIVLRRKRIRQLGGTVPPVGETLERNRSTLRAAAITLGGLLVLCLLGSGAVFAYDAWEGAVSRERWAAEQAASDAEYARHRAEMAQFPARDAYPPVTTPAAMPPVLAVPSVEVATARLTAADFRVTPSTSTDCFGSARLWALHAEGDGGQTLEVCGYRPLTADDAALPFNVTCETGPAGSVCSYVRLTPSRYASETYQWDAYAGWRRWLVSTLAVP